MNPRRVAMIFGHPAHELSVAGMLQRWRPQILYLTRSDSGGEQNRPETTARTLARIGLKDNARFMGMSELESYERLLRAEHQWYDSYFEEICAWLKAVRPTAIFCDAFEFFNVHHDISSAMASAASYRLGLEAEVFHLPLAYNSGPERIARPYADYDEAGWGCSYFSLRPEEGRAKLGLLSAAAPDTVELPELLGKVSKDRLEAEPYRPVLESRQFLVRPRAYGWATWEETGAERARQGKYREALSFERHFAPLVEHLGLARQT